MIRKYKSKNKLRPTTSKVQWAIFSMIGSGAQRRQNEKLPESPAADPTNSFLSSTQSSYLAKDEDRDSLDIEQIEKVCKLFMVEKNIGLSKDCIDFYKTLYRKEFL